MIADDFDVLSTLVPLDEAQAPLIVDPDAVLATAITYESCEPVAGRRLKRFERDDRVQLRQLSFRDALDVCKTPRLSRNE